ncbi:hypothetical protein [Kitasatospora phosalacinea]|uniref:hypothetical protein n=1 Tax=Kitasatospora phosalacinea TaxID=2065 RepID=UPI00052748C7|nr:hypothetical protein [Kitasatospora phosalacinea]
MPADLTPVIAASARWLLNAYPPPPGALSRALAEAQARQAAALAAALRYPTAIDGQLLDLLGPGGSGRLDGLTGCDPRPDDTAWRTWVDETVVSWAACLLADPDLAGTAHRALDATEHRTGALRRLTDPGTHGAGATALLRHPDLTDAVAGLHRTALLAALGVQGAEPA